VTRRGLMAACAVALVLGCTEDPTAPATCPDFCPGGNITLVDTLLTTVIERDTAYRGYLEPRGSAALLAASLPTVVDSRPIVLFQSLGKTVQLAGDTAQRNILVTDSVRLALTVIRRDTSVRNLRLQLYRLPRNIDSTTSFADLTGAFTDSLVRTVNVDSLVRAANHKDTVTKDSVFVATNLSVRVMLKLGQAEAPFSPADSGTLAYGVRIVADTFTSAAFGSNESGDPPIINWFFSVDSSGTTTHTTRVVAPQFDSYVFNPPLAPLDSTLAVGGMPSERSLLRVVLPRRFRDSTQIVRATLQLMPSTIARGAPRDSFTLVAHAVAADLGGKSTLLGGTDSSYFGTGPVLIGSSDTVRVEITRILRRWSTDTLLPNTFVLRSGSEGIILTEIRFQPSQHPTLAPTIRVTYSSPFPFGTP